MAVGVPYADVGTTLGAGFAALVLGDCVPFPNGGDLVFGSGANLVLQGFFRNAAFGASVGGPGDINGDGFDDWAVGAPRGSAGAVSGGHTNLFYAC